MRLDNLLAGLEVGLQTMVKKEVAVFIIGPIYAYGKKVMNSLFYTGNPFSLALLFIYRYTEKWPNVHKIQYNG